MKKYFALAFSIFAILCLILLNAPTEKHVSDPAKLMEYTSAEEVINASELIVKVTKISENPVDYELGNGAAEKFTLSKVKVEKMIKPQAGESPRKGDEISILEAEYRDPITGIVHHMENYKKMEIGKEYTLYLGYNKEVENYYVIGLLYGKIPMDRKEPLFYGNLSIERINEITKDLQTRSWNE